MYKELSNEELSTLETCQLISEHEQSLKSTQNYRECFQKLLQECPPQGNYQNKNVIPWPADWPGWYYPKKKIALGKCSQLRQSVIPEQGQFHVSLNAAEDAVTIFKHFFEKLFKTVFGKDLPHKPKTYKNEFLVSKETVVLHRWERSKQKSSDEGLTLKTSAFQIFHGGNSTFINSFDKTYKVTLCLTAALLGWLQIPDKVLQKFGICKDHEYVSVIYLLEHVLPLVFFQYNIFRGGDILQYENLMAQMAVIFIC